MSYLLTNKALSDVFGSPEFGTYANGLLNNHPLFTSINEKTGDTVRFNETADGHTVEIDLPGVKKPDCKVELFQAGSNVKVYVKASRKITHKGGTRDETFTREFSLREAREESIKAVLEDGVLTITAPIEVNKNRRKVIELQ